jgi:DNA-binding MarR family transcriptional regulator
LKQRKRNACLAAIEHLRRNCGDMSLSDVLAFMYVCENSGINIRELSQLSGLTPSSASRAARRLASADAPAALPPALGLIELNPQPNDKRGRVASLSPNGLRLRHELDQIIASATPLVLSAD